MTSDDDVTAVVKCPNNVIIFESSDRVTSIPNRKLGKEVGFFFLGMWTVFASRSHMKPIYVKIVLKGKCFKGDQGHPSSAVMSQTSCSHIG